MKHVRSAALLLLVVPALARAGTPLFGPELDVDLPVLTGAPGDQTAAAAAWDGQQFLVAWRTSLWKSELRAVRMTASGEVLDGRGVRLDGFERTEGRVAIAAGGGGFLVAWSREPSRIQAARIAPSAGAELSAPAPLLVAEGPTDVASAGPAVVWYGGGFWVLWSLDGSAAGVYGARMAPDGTMIDHTPIRLAASFGVPSAAWDGSHTLAAWTTATAAGVELRASRLEADGRVAAPEVLLALTGDIAGPSAIAWGEGSYLAAAAGLQRAGGGSDVRAIRVSAEGRALDGGLTLAPPGGPAAGGPTVAWNGTRFAVLWATEALEAGRHTPRLAGRWMAPGGTTEILDPTGWSASGALPFAAAATPQT
jgi:hypothetical protein